MTVQNVLPRDSMPSIDDPEFGDEHTDDSDDEVIVVDADPPRAYPIRILLSRGCQRDGIRMETTDRDGHRRRTRENEARYSPVGHGHVGAVHH